MGKLSDKITIVFATSPHRFGESDSMLALNIELINGSQLKDCRKIICADGLNPHSQYKSKEAREGYSSYLSNLKKKLKNVDFYFSNKHIGLTKNYLQAWDNGISTEYTLLMNHDAVLCDDILNVNFSKLLKNWPEEIASLIFPREINNERAGNWWRERLLTDHPKIKNIPEGWEKCRIAFGNQDHSNLLKTNHFLKMVENFYTPEKTHFLEDSIQEYLQNLDNEDFKGWDKFKGCVYFESVTLHIDGQSKAGEEHEQIQQRGGEEVWSNGQVFWFDFLRFKRLEKNNPMVSEKIQNLIDDNLKFHSKICKNKFLSLFESASYLNVLSEAKNLFNKEQDNLLSVRNITLKFPEKKELFNYNLEIYNEHLVVNWKNPEGKNFVLKAINEKNNKEICFGGHKTSSKTINFKEFDIKEDDILIFKFYDYTSKTPPFKVIREDKLQLESFRFLETGFIIQTVIENEREIKAFDTDMNSLNTEEVQPNCFYVNTLNLNKGAFIKFKLQGKNSETIWISLANNKSKNKNILTESLRKDFVNFLYQTSNLKDPKFCKGKSSYWQGQLNQIHQKKAEQ